MAGHPSKATRRTTGGGVKNSTQSERRDMFTSLPGKIIDFDPATQTATIQPMHKATVNGQAVDPPNLLEVPVSIPRGGGFSMTSPVKAGDFVTLNFMGTDMSTFQETGEASQAPSDRLNSMSDAVATLGGVPSSQALGSYDTDNMHLGPDGDRAAGLRMDGSGKVAIEAGGEELLTIIDELLQLLVDERTTPPNTPFSKQGDYSALKGRLAALKLR